MAKSANNAINETLKEFERIRPLHEQFTERLAELLSRLLSDSPIKIHAIEKRTKSLDSFRQKFLRPGKRYKTPLAQVTDVSGIRIILYNQEDLQRVVEMIESEFTVDEDASGDQGVKLGANEFGYRSIHYIVSLSAERLKLKEWKPYSALKGEIQIRTVLQHAWAAISHALHYKHEREVPLPLSRKLFRLSGLLELADEEFSSLNRAIEGFASKVSEDFETGIPNIPVDRASLSEFVERSDIVKQLKELAKAAGFNFEMDDEEGSDDLSALAWYCSTAELHSIRELDSLLQRDLSLAKQFLNRVIGNDKGWGASDIFILELIILLHCWKKFSVDILESKGWNDRIADKVLSAARAVNPKKERGK